MVSTYICVDVVTAGIPLKVNAAVPPTVSDDAETPMRIAVAMLHVLVVVVGIVGSTKTDALAVLSAGVGSVLDGLSPTVAVFVIVVPPVPALAVAAIASVAVELAGMLPIVQTPVLLE